MFEIKVNMPSASQLEKEIIDIVKKDLTKKASSTRCSVHNKYAKITLKGSSASKLNFEVSGCCQQLIDDVTKKIK